VSVLNAMSEPVKHIVDALAGVTLLATLLSWLPAIGAVLAVIWTALTARQTELADQRLKGTPMSELTDALARNDGNKAATARELGIPVTTSQGQLAKRIRVHRNGPLHPDRPSHWRSGDGVGKDIFRPPEGR
jgi:hypothetical protein